MQARKGGLWEGGAPAPPTAESFPETPFGEADASPSQGKRSSIAQTLIAPSLP